MTRVRANEWGTLVEQIHVHLNKFMVEIMGFICLAQHRVV